MEYTVKLTVSLNAPTCFNIANREINFPKGKTTREINFANEQQVNEFKNKFASLLNSGIIQMQSIISPVVVSKSAGHTSTKKGKSGK